MASSSDMAMALKTRLEDEKVHIMYYDIWRLAEWQY